MQAALVEKRGGFVGSLYLCALIHKYSNGAKSQTST